MMQKASRITCQVFLYSAMMSCVPKGESSSKISQITEESTNISISMDSTVINTSMSDTLQTAASRLEAATTTSDLLIFIQDFIKAEFSRSRQDLIDQNIDNGYTVSEIKVSGKALIYELNFNEFEGTQIYMAIPDMGESNISFVGDQTMVKDFFDQVKLTEKWDRKDASESGEGLEIRKPWNGKPIVTYITMTYTENGKEATLMTNRKFAIEN